MNQQGSQALDLYPLPFGLNHTGKKQFCTHVELDINTPRGQKTLKDEMLAYQIYEACVPAHKITVTDKTKPIKIDAFVNENGVQIAGVETKCRYDVTAEEFFSQKGYRGHWLITAEHVDSAARITHALMIPLWGFLYIVRSKKLYVQLLCDDDGEIANLVGQKVMPTQRSTNGGIATRLNSFFDMTDAIEIVRPNGKMVGPARHDLATHRL